MTLTITENTAPQSDIRAFIANDGERDIDLMWHLAKNKESCLTKFMCRLVARYGAGIDLKVGC